MLLALTVHHQSVHLVLNYSLSIIESFCLKMIYEVKQQISHLLITKKSRDGRCSGEVRIHSAIVRPAHAKR
ncbi:hypothetical protein X798_01508 [Onchocerca flexuosa]|uniref:Uncharacterized protein n=1 Tax=Onchocerca flexuosa TaxID=387005 RepID=A0A238C3C8_9BILA|nr:hypothetical protein X798_01508 [Onchocerca flexuosa]